MIGFQRHLAHEGCLLHCNHICQWGNHAGLSLISIDCCRVYHIINSLNLTLPQDKVIKSKSFSERTASEYLSQILDAISYMHKFRIQLFFPLIAKFTVCNELTTDWTSFTEVRYVIIDDM